MSIESTLSLPLKELTSSRLMAQGKTRSSELLFQTLNVGYVSLFPKDSKMDEGSSCFLRIHL